MTTVQLVVGEKQEGEASRSVQACNDYLRMGSGRSLEKLHQCYTESTPNKPPTKNLRTLKGWSTKFGWVKRAETYDAQIEATKTAEAEKLLTEGLAATHERVRELSKIYKALDSEFEKGIWFTDKKISAKGDVIEVDVFNNALLSQMRGVLDDLAKETGGRRQQVDLMVEKEIDKFLDLLEDNLDASTYQIILRIAASTGS